LARRGAFAIRGCGIAGTYYWRFKDILFRHLSGHLFHVFQVLLLAARTGTRIDRVLTVSEVRELD